VHKEEHHITCLDQPTVLSVLTSLDLQCQLVQLKALNMTNIERWLAQLETLEWAMMEWVHHRSTEEAQPQVPLLTWLTQVVMLAILQRIQPTQEVQDKLLVMVEPLQAITTMEQPQVPHTLDFLSQVRAQRMLHTVQEDLELVQLEEQLQATVEEWVA
jgi:hypothetical protein